MACTVQTAGPGAGPVDPVGPAPGPAPVAGACVDPGGAEVSDQYDEAMVIEPQGTITGCTSRGDTDIYVLTVPEHPAGTVVELRLRGENQMAPRLELLDGDRNRVEYASGGKAAEIMTWAHVAPGTSLYVRVNQVHGVDETYTLALASGPMTEAGEPNDTWESATPLALATPLQGIMSAAVNNRDALLDWYRFEATAKGKVEVVADMTGEIAAKVEVLDSDRKRVAYKSAGRGARVRFEVDVKPGTYYLSLASVHQVTPAGDKEIPPRISKPYTLTVTPR